MERTEEQVRKVEQKVDEVEAAVRDVGSQIEASKKTALSIETAVGQAYSNGLDAGSASASDLQNLVTDLKESIAASASAREMAMEALASAKEELSATTQANAHLRGQIATITANNDEMFWKLSDANDQLKVGIQVAKERDEAIKNTLTIITERDNALKYKRGVWVVISLIILYVFARIAIATGKWTPHGKIARLFL
jgi:chromosome segregation ATPase